MTTHKELELEIERLYAAIRKTVADRDMLAQALHDHAPHVRVVENSFTAWTIEVTENGNA
jgi:hypothetical protein